MCQTTPSCVCSPTNELQRRYSNVFRKCSPECGSMPDTSNDGLIDPLSRIGFRPAGPSSDAYFSRDSKYTQWEILLQACLARRGTNLADVQQQERKAKSCCGNQKPVPRDASAPPKAFVFVGQHSAEMDSGGGPPFLCPPTPESMNRLLIG